MALAYLLVIDGSCIWGQDQPALKLNIVIVEGEGAINNIHQRTAREPIVQVEDENHKPVAGATVLFLMPDHGPSAVFAGGSHSMTVMTDENGRAIAHGLRPNSASGNFQIQVNVSYHGVTANATIAQVNAAAAAGIAEGTVSLIILGVAAAIVTGVYFGVRGGSHSQITTPICRPNANGGGC
jgi:hypothetical protein